MLNDEWLNTWEMQMREKGSLVLKKRQTTRLVGQGRFELGYFAARCEGAINSWEVTVRIACRQYL